MGIEPSLGQDLDNALALAFEGLALLSRGRIVRMNPPMAEMLGYAPDAAVGWTLADLLAPASREAALRRLAAGEAAVDAVALREDGAHMAVELRQRAYGAPGADMAIVSMRPAPAAQAIADRHALILSSTGEGIYGIDRSGTLTFINPAGAAMLGYAPEALVGMSLVGMAPTPLACLGFPFEEGPTPGFYEEVFWRGDGTSFFARYVVTPIIEAGETIGAVVSFSDVSEHKRAEGKLRAANHELLRLGALKDEFLSMISHELRTPLAAIRTALAILAKEKAGPLTATQARFVAMVCDHVLRLNRLVDDVLDFQKLEAGVMDYHMTLMDLRPLVREVLEGYAPVFAAKRQQVTVSLPSQPLLARVDPDRLSQVLINLLSNAAKFTPEGERVHIEGGLEGDRVHLRVRDFGVGIAPADLERVFGRFVQLDGGLTRAAGGTGLGLAICRKLIEDGHAGRIWASRPDGGGTELHVALPVQAASDGPTPRT
jgi:PAS domain S-box-containing protein